MIAGNGGHGLGKLTRKATGPLRAPVAVQDAAEDRVVLESYDDQGCGYLRLRVTTTQLRIECHPAGDGATAKTPDDSVTVDLATRRIAHFNG